MEGNLPIFRDRSEAGRKLAAKIASLRMPSPALVWGLARGGVAVAYEVARALEAPLGVMVVRKLGVPSQRELALGAIAPHNTYILNEALAEDLQLTGAQITEILAKAERDMKRQVRLYSRWQPTQDVRGRLIFLVDDGLATGATMQAAISAARLEGAAQIIVAVPVAPADVCAQLQPLVDRFVCLEASEQFWAVGACYQDFTQVEDREVCRWLREAQQGTNAVRRTGTREGRAADGSFDAPSFRSYRPPAGPCPGPTCVPYSR